MPAAPGRNFQVAVGRSATVRLTMPDPQPSKHVKRAKVAKRVQLVLAIASAGFVLWRLVAAFMPGTRFLGR
jgi:hypothetical protein